MPINILLPSHLAISQVCCASIWSGTQISHRAPWGVILIKSSGIQPLKTIRIQVETYDGCRTIWYEKSKLKNPTEVISKRVNEQLCGLNLKRIEVSLSPATVWIMNYFNTNIIRNHDDIMTLNNWQVDFFNMMLGFTWLNDSERDIYAEEKKTYLCYDVW